MAHIRLQQTLRHLQPGASHSVSFLQGPIDIPLLNIHLGELIDQQANQYGDHAAIIFPAQEAQLSYRQLSERCTLVSKALIASGIRPGDRVGIMAGNCVAYVELFFAVSQIGAIFVVINNTYMPHELLNAVKHIGCKYLFTTHQLGRKDNREALSMLSSSWEDVPQLEAVVLLKDYSFPNKGTFLSYEEVIRGAGNVSDDQLSITKSLVSADDVCNLQFTSGTTGNPKAAMLTHLNIINNGRFTGDCMRLTEKDVLCCPPPLFHCFGLVLGLLAAVTHGSTIVFPGEDFDAIQVLDAVSRYKCTALHGVPAMWAAEMELIKPEHNVQNLRTGIAAGSSTPPQMMSNLRKKLNLTELTNTYGMTETSPASFMTTPDDPLEQRLNTVGKILPHTTAKIIDPTGRILPLGERGELCVSGYLLQKGYWNNREKTNEVMIRDENGVLWMHTGDEASFDIEGYCRITGRIKDIIIRGGENIFPLEIEDRLVQHPAIVNASVVGIQDEKFGEVVGAFLQARENNGINRPSAEDIRQWVRQKLGRHKAPKYVFWLGDKNVGFESYPLTGSGKIKKNVLRDVGNSLVKKNAV